MKDNKNPGALYTVLNLPQHDGKCHFWERLIKGTLIKKNMASLAPGSVFVGARTSSRVRHQPVPLPRPRGPRHLPPSRDRQGTPGS